MEVQAVGVARHREKAHVGPGWLHDAETLRGEAGFMECTVAWVWDASPAERDCIVTEVEALGPF